MLENVDFNQEFRSKLNVNPYQLCQFALNVNLIDNYRADHSDIRNDKSDVRFNTQ